MGYTSQIVWTETQDGESLSKTEGGGRLETVLRISNGYRETLDIVQVPGDGKCFYRAFLWATGEKETNRNVVIKLQIEVLESLIRQNISTKGITIEILQSVARKELGIPEDILNSFETTGDYYGYILEEVKKGKGSLCTWADHIEIQATSNITGYPITILETRRGLVTRIHPENPSGPPKKPVILLYTNNNHYSAVIPRGGGGSVVSIGSRISNGRTSYPASHANQENIREDAEVSKRFLESIERVVQMSSSRNGSLYQRDSNQSFDFETIQDSIQDAQETLDTVHRMPTVQGMREMDQKIHDVVRIVLMYLETYDPKRVHEVVEIAKKNPGFFSKVQKFAKSTGKHAERIVKRSSAGELTMSGLVLIASSMVTSVWGSWWYVFAR